MRGRKPATTAEKNAKGERRPSRVNYAEPEVPAPSDTALEAAPKDLRGAGFRLWRDHAQAMVQSGQLRSTDMPIFLRLCKTASDIETYEKRSRQGNDQAMRLKIQLESLFLRLAAECGMTSVARSRVKTVNKPPVEKPKHERFFGKLHAIRGGRT